MKAVCFGEIMMRLNPEGYKRFVQAEGFEASYGGGEANVAVSLANYGVEASFVTKLPDNDLGKSARNSVRRFGVDTSNIVWGGARLGIYFVEKGAAQRASKVIYDRAGSSIATASRGDFNWDAILQDVDWFHFTGITPALGGELPEICLDALKICKERKITVSCDLNYRAKLWSREKACEVMSRLLPYVDICIANESDMADVFGIHASGSDIEGARLDRQGYAEAARALHERFGCGKVAITLRSSLSASDNKWSGMLWTEEQVAFATEYLMHIVDRVGGGDSFGGGLIYALSSGCGVQESIEFAVAASCLKHSVELDFNHVGIAEVRSLMAGNASGRVVR